MLKALVQRLAPLSFSSLVGLVAPAFPVHAAADVTPPLPDIRDAYGVALADYDGDGDIDLYLVGFRSLNRLLLNRGDGTFRDASIASGAGGNLMPQGNKNLELGATAVDFDNDGGIDLMVAGWGDGLEALRNRGDGTFEAVGRKLGLDSKGNANMASFADLDQDGWLDLLLTDESGPMRLYRNDRGLHFNPIPLEQTGLPSDSGSQAAVFTDLNLDGRADLAVAGWHHPAQVFVAVGPFRFQALPLDLTWPAGSRCNAALHGDVDGDGDMDLLFTVRGGRPRLLRNAINPSRFAETPETWVKPTQALRFDVSDSASGIDDSLDAYGGAFFDADGDGDLDLYLTGRQVERFYENVGDRFQAKAVMALGWSTTGSLYSTGFAFGSLSRQPGEAAVVATRDTGSVLLPPVTPRFPQALIRLHGVRSNPPGAGSQITLWKRVVDAPAVKPPLVWKLVALRDLPGTQGYLSSYLGPLALYPDDSAGDYRVRVVFPTGKVVTRRLDGRKGNLDVWEMGLFGGVGVHAERLAQVWLGDWGHFKKLGLALLLAVFVAALLREAVRITARSIARRENTKALEAKNRELETLLAQLHNTQAQLIQHEKLASLGQLVAGIAHELNNPIGFIYANLHQIGRYLADLPTEAVDERTRRNLSRIAEALKESQDGAMRVRDIVQNLRGLARTGADRPDKPPTKAPCDLREPLEKALSVARTGFAPGIDIARDFRDIPLVQADAGQLQQVFLNLLVNAGQALGEKGRITLATRLRDGQVIATVADNGPGIAPEHIARLFDPFFTTKDVGQGLGLGLHLAYSIVKAHGGNLSVQSQPGHGASFEVSLPDVFSAHGHEQA